MTPKFKVHQYVECSEMPGIRYEIVDVVGDGDCAQYMLENSEGERYGYVLADSLKFC